jgi:hypothetical protein
LKSGPGSSRAGARALQPDKGFDEEACFDCSPDRCGSPLPHRRLGFASSVPTGAYPVCSPKATEMNCATDVLRWADDRIAAERDHSDR